MSYNSDFLKPIGTDKNIKIYNSIGDLSYTIKPTFIDTIISNVNVLDITLKNGKLISLDFNNVDDSINAEVKLLKRVQDLLETNEYIDNNTQVSNIETQNFSYSYDKFLRPLTESDRNIKILDNNGLVKFTIDPFSITNTIANNNLIKINLKSSKIISLDFSSTNEAKISLIRLREQIDILIEKTPLLIDKDVENYIVDLVGGLTVSSTNVIGTLNYITKYDSTGITQSIISDNGTTINIGVTPSVGTISDSVILRDSSGNLVQLAISTITEATTLQQVLDNHGLIDGKNYQGTDAGTGNTGIEVIAIGTSAAQENSGSGIVALGYAAAFENLGLSVNAIGTSAAQGNSGTEVNAIGTGAALNNTAENVNAFGSNAGLNNTFRNVNLFGYQANADAENQTAFTKFIDNVTYFSARLSFNNITTNRKWELPDTSGTLIITINGATADANGNIILTATGSQGATGSQTTTTRNANNITYDLPAATNASSGSLLSNNAYIEGYVTPSADGTVIARFASEGAGLAITAIAGSVVYYQQLN